MSLSYKGFTLNNPGDAAPWSTIEQQAYKDIIDTVVKDCVSQGKQATIGHQHYRLYNALGSSDVQVMVDANKNVIVGPASAGSGADYITAADSKLHVYTGSAGGVTAPAGTALTIESATAAYISLLSPNASEQRIFFGTPSDNDAGIIEFAHGTSVFNMITGAATCMSVSPSAVTLSPGGTPRLTVMSPVTVASGTNLKLGVDRVAASNTTITHYIEVVDTSNNTVRLACIVG